MLRIEHAGTPPNAPSHMHGEAGGQAIEKQHLKAEKN